jgi:hypothetical protein
MALFRISPQGPPEAYKTYGIRAPKETHFRPATCGEVDCSAYLYGWKTTIDEGTVLGRMQAHYIRKESGRRYEEEWNNGLTTFYFEAGQHCFAQHQTALEREPIFLVKDGDWRGNPRRTNPRIHTKPEHWVEDFAEHQQALKERIEHG